MQAVLSLWVVTLLYIQISCVVSIFVTQKCAARLTDMPQAEPQVWSWTLVMGWRMLSPYMKDSLSPIPSCAWTSPGVTSLDTSACSCARKATISTPRPSSRLCAPSRRYDKSFFKILQLPNMKLYKHYSLRARCCTLQVRSVTTTLQLYETVFQRACYLSLNPQKDETLETEKAQYTLPDGSTLDVSKKIGQVFKFEFICYCTGWLYSQLGWSSVDWPGTVQSSRASLQARSDWRWEWGHSRGAGFRYSEVRHGPTTHALLKYSAVWWLDAP